MRFQYSAHSHYLSFLLAISLLLSACGSATATPALPAASPEPTAGWLQIYFTDPTSPHARDYEGGPDEDLAAAIDRARLSVDMAAYDLNLWSIRDALIHAEQRGVVVRMVMESENMNESEVQELIGAGIPIVGDQLDGLMHDKFVVIDRAEVWTGSMNYTVGAAYRDNNNLIRIQSSQVAEDYLSEFEEMYTYDRFGPYGLADTPHPKLSIDGTPVEVYFSPDDGVAARLLELIKGAQESIDFMAYTFTSNELGEAVIERAQAGLKVAGVMDDDQINFGEGTEYDTFLQAGLDVRRSDDTDGLMHHKVMIIDEKIVVTGSYNFTASAEEDNDENVVIISNPDVAAAFMQEFQRVYAQAQP